MPVPFFFPVWLMNVPQFPTSTVVISYAVMTVSASHALQKLQQSSASMPWPLQGIECLPLFTYSFLINWLGIWFSGYLFARSQRLFLTACSDCYDSLQTVCKCNKRTGAPVFYLGELTIQSRKSRPEVAHLLEFVTFRRSATYAILTRMRTFQKMRFFLQFMHAIFFFAYIDNELATLVG